MYFTIESHLINQSLDNWQWNNGNHSTTSAIAKKKSEKNPFFQKSDFLAFKSPFELTTIGVKDTDMIKIYFYGA